MPEYDQEMYGKMKSLYGEFEKYPSTGNWCSFCWSEDYMVYLKETPVKELDDDCVHKLRYETADHYESVDAYKHYLPRIIESMIPPHDSFVYPRIELFERLEHFDYVSWPENEKKAIVDIIHYICEKIIGNDEEEDVESWEDGLCYVRDEVPLPPYDDEC